MRARRSRLILLLNWAWNSHHATCSAPVKCPSQFAQYTTSKPGIGWPRPAQKPYLLLPSTGVPGQTSAHSKVSPFSIILQQTESALAIIGDENKLLSFTASLYRLACLAISGLGSHGQVSPRRCARGLQSRISPFIRIECYNLYMQDAVKTTPNGSPERRRYDLTKDPIYYITFGFFALLTTALPAALGQPNFLPIAQTVAITLFLAVPLRRGLVGRSILVLSAWLVLQTLIMIVGTALLPVLFERAIHDGFAYHRSLLEWSVTGQDLPGWLLNAPGARLVELFGVLLGSLFSAGLVGLWFLMRAVNQFAYAVGRLSMEGPPGLLLGLMPWRLSIIAGYAGFVVLLAQPLLNNAWNPAFYITRQRRLITVSIALVALGLLLEVTLPGVWRMIWPL